MSIRFGIFRLRDLKPVRKELYAYRSSNFLRDITLNCEDVLEVSVVAFRPQVLVCFSVDHLNRDANLLADLTNASLKYRSHVKLLRNFFDVLWIFLVLHY